ncbi:MAG: PAS domain S-box protein [Chloroflexi bacterium]|nr:PAS domain S-box protein [Chloroflexota bacterium]
MKKSIEKARKEKNKIPRLHHPAKASLTGATKHAKRTPRNGPPKKTDSQVAETEKRFSQVWDTASDALLLTDPNGIVLEVNPAFCQLYGRSRDQLLGKPVTIALPKQMHSQAIADYKTFFHSEIVPAPLEAWIRRDDGTECFVESRFDFITEKNQRTALLSITRDLTARKQSEEQLKNQLRGLASLNSIANAIVHSASVEQLLEASLDIALDLTDLATGSVHLIGEEDNVPHMIAQRGFSPVKLKQATEMHTAWASQAAVRLLSESIIEGIPGEVGLVLTTEPQKQQAYVAIPIRTKTKLSGTLILVGTSLHLVNETDKARLTTIGYQLGVAIENFRLVEKTAEVKALRELDRLRSELIANVSHELRTPLGLIKVFCTTLMAKDVAFDRSARFEFLNDIDRETDKLEKIVSNLLDLSQLQNNRLRLDKRALDLGELITTVIDEMKFNLIQHKVVYEMPVEPLSVMADPQRLEQVLRNLIGNAVKYSPDGGTIKIQCRKENQQILVGVQDQGIGIPVDDLERIFERFYRVGNETTRRVGGVGLGLSVSRGIVEEHGGKIWAESSLGKGSTFYFTLPQVNTPRSSVE